MAFGEASGGAWSSSGAAARLRQAGGTALGAGWARALDLVYPPRCPITDEAVTRHGAFAPAAWAQATLLAPPWCSACGLPFGPSDAVATLCVPCAAPTRFRSALTGPGKLDALRAAMAYDEASAPMILGLKYGDRQDVAPALARLLDRAGEEVLTDGAILVPVPLHPRRLRARRFNQAAVLAQNLARLSGHAAAPMALRRVKPTPPQKGMSPAARRRNVAGAFTARGPAPERVVLIDDVLTSGATLLGCARALRRAGARHVSALTLARVVKTRV